MKTKPKKILNIGCGNTRIPGSIGVDRVAIPDFVDVVHDLDQVPYPFAKNSIDEIHMYHVLEHLHEPLRKIEELHRILKPGGTLYMRVPHFSSLGAFTDITHVRPFGYTSFDPLEPGHNHHYYTTVAFKILNKQIKYFGLYPNDGVYAQYIHPNQCVWFAKPFVRLFNFLIACSPVLFERIWCYWVGGAMEVVITLQKQET
ncbi:class I SAM-dependent methyltransferase [Patescibacteria group bacterium]|nr:class I SAM-dependent methyltransferase [Patescibacteria group bacterium]